MTPTTVHAVRVSASGKARRRAYAVQHDDEVWYFRGTSLGFRGSRALQQIGITSVATDPVVATIFAIESSNYGTGVVHVASATALAAIRLVPGNVLAELECEVGLEVPPEEFARHATSTITAVQARAILRELGIVLPSIIRGPAGVDAALRATPRLTREQRHRFIDAAQSSAGR